MQLSLFRSHYHSFTFLGYSQGRTGCQEIYRERKDIETPKERITWTAGHRNGKIRDYSTTRRQILLFRVKTSFLDLFRTPNLRKITIMIIILWMLTSLLFDASVRSILIFRRLESQTFFSYKKFNILKNSSVNILNYQIFRSSALFIFSYKKFNILKNSSVDILNYQVFRSSALFKTIFFYI